MKAADEQWQNDCGKVDSFRSDLNRRLDVANFIVTQKEEKQLKFEKAIEKVERVYRKIKKKILFVVFDYRQKVPSTSIETEIDDIDELKDDLMSAYRICQGLSTPTNEVRRQYDQGMEVYYDLMFVLEQMRKEPMMAVERKKEILKLIHNKYYSQSASGKKLEKRSDLVSSNHTAEKVKKLAEVNVQVKRSELKAKERRCLATLDSVREQIDLVDREEKIIINDNTHPQVHDSNRALKPTASPLLPRAEEIVKPKPPIFHVSKPEYQSTFDSLSESKCNRSVLESKDIKPEKEKIKDSVKESKELVLEHSILKKEIEVQNGKCKEEALLHKNKRLGYKKTKSKKIKDSVKESEDLVLTHSILKKEIEVQNGMCKQEALLDKKKRTDYKKTRSKYKKREKRKKRCKRLRQKEKRVRKLRNNIMKSLRLTSRLWKREILNFKKRKKTFLQNSGDEEEDDDDDDDDNGGGDDDDDDDDDDNHRDIAKCCIIKSLMNRYF